MVPHGREGGFPTLLVVVLALSALVNFCFLARSALSASASEMLELHTSHGLGRALEEVAAQGAQTSPMLARALGGSSSGSSSEDASTDHKTHPHDAMIFLFNAFICGAALMHLSTVFHNMQMTVVLFVLGVLVSLVFEGLDVKNSLGVFGDTYNMWMEIDPHLLLFALLPALLAGDAMTIDTSVAKKVAYQCMYFAGPCVLINAFAVAAFLSWLLNWDFLLSLVTGSILCATDPVAVVALLKELGASPVLTVQIQGESLLNDGTAIVLFMISYNMLSGVEYDLADIIMFLVKVALMAWALGMFIGYFFFSWIRMASNKLDHNSGMIQIVLSLCCAYWSFIMAEGVFGWSGVLATVASSLVLAHNMWPHVVSHGSMHHVWHMIETLGNFVIFFLAGALTGNVMVKIELMDYLNLLVIWLVLLVVRGAVIFGSRPILKLLSADKQPVSKEDALVMTWGGLRGAVGLALAIQVHNGRADGQITEDTGCRVLFFVAGIALLTTVVNASTAPMLVNWLEITALPESQLKLLKMIYGQLKHYSESSKHPQQVVLSIQQMLENVEKHIGNSKVRLETPVCKTKSRPLTPADSVFESNDDLAARHAECKANYVSLKHEEVQLLGDLPEGHLLGSPDADDWVALITGAEVDAHLAKAVNKAFLNLVSAKYWKMLEDGDLRPGSSEADALFSSVRFALSPLTVDLGDVKCVRQHVEGYSRDLVLKWWKVFPEDDKTGVCQQAPTVQMRLQKAVASSGFNIFIALAIVLNALFVALEEGFNSNDDSNAGWWVIEALFTIVFLSEFVMKFGAFRLEYFKDSPNVFDFLLVILGLIGTSVGLQVLVEGDSGASKGSDIIRILRVFRVLRFLRIFRLFHAKLSADPTVSTQVAERMHKITTIMCFVHAHLMSQVDMVKYFSTNGKLDDKDTEDEIARCILQSQCAVYDAIGLAVKEEQQMDKALLEELLWYHMRKDITEGLESFVMSAFKDNAISSREAESILHPLHKQISQCLLKINYLAQGRVVDLNANRAAVASKLFRTVSERARQVTSRSNSKHDARPDGAPHTPRTPRTDSKHDSRPDGTPGGVVPDPSTIGKVDPTIGKVDPESSES